MVVPARCADGTRNSNRYPYVESMFEDATIQSYIHNCIVQVREGSTSYRYMFFFKRHCCLRVNRTIAGAILRGDLIVMRVSATNNLSVVNMRERDTILADWVAPRSAQASSYTQVQKLTCFQICSISEPQTTRSPATVTRLPQALVII